MVSTAVVREHNAQFAKSKHTGVVCVFTGGTSGIGAGTLERMIQQVQSSTFYVLGRSAQRFENQRMKLEGLGPSNKIVFVLAEVSLVSDIDAACKQIAAEQQKVDYLYMSAGLVPLNGAEYTKEGLETCFAVSYYCRLRLVYNLLPLLRQAPRPKVLSALNGGEEGSMNEADLGLEHSWSLFGVIYHTTTMMTLALEYLATLPENQPICFIHCYPGFVSTNFFARLAPPEGSGVVWTTALAGVRAFVGTLMALFAMPPEQCGERQAFLLTSDNFGPGAWRVNSWDEEVTSPGVLKKYREGPLTERIWEQTLQTFDLALDRNSPTTTR